MAFSQKLKEKLLINCARICCICLRQSGVKMEIDHIDPQATGGSDTEDNAIPVCLFCHAEIKHYNNDHPKGNKFRPGELRAARDRLFALVDSGAIFAQIIAAQHHTGVSGEIKTLPLNVSPQTTGADAVRLLQQFVKQGAQLDSPGSRFGLLNAVERAYILDRLIEQASGASGVTHVLLRICDSSFVSPDEARVIRERTAKEIAFLGNWATTSTLFEVLNPDDFAQLPETLRIALFEVALDLVRQDQFDVVNRLVPSMIAHINSVPEELHLNFIDSMLRQSHSSSFNGAPAAKLILREIPDKMLTAGLKLVNREYLCERSYLNVLRPFVVRLLAVASNEQKEYLKYFSESPRQFREQHCPDD